MSLARSFERLPTGLKLFLILTAALLPIGIALSWIGQNGIRAANSVLRERTEDRSRATAQAIESLIARNALALRIAANGTVGGDGDACARARQALAVTPAVARNFVLQAPDGRLLCVSGMVRGADAVPLAAPGAVRVQVAPDSSGLILRIGVVGGMATAILQVAELGNAIGRGPGAVEAVAVRDSTRELLVLGGRYAQQQSLAVTEWPIASGALVVRVTARVERIATVDRLLLLLPLLMWIAAALITWLLVNRLLLRPLKRLQRGVLSYQPGSGELDLPLKLGPSREIQELRHAFARTVARVDESDREKSGALEGQRRLVREVHHRVKNNLQVVASLLNIHGRSAGTVEARAAYASISRRVGALSIVHRNHFAEMEDNRGISLRPLLSELAAELRAGAPEEARGLRIDLDLDTIYTTQDVAVAVAFLVTEIVEFAMLYCPTDPIEISLRRTSELTGRLALSSRVLDPEQADQPEKVQFERIITGLAKQLRSALERNLGRYSVDLPVFPPA